MGFDEFDNYFGLEMREWLERHTRHHSPEDEPLVRDIDLIRDITDRQLSGISGFLGGQYEVQFPEGHGFRLNTFGRGTATKDSNSSDFNDDPFSVLLKQAATYEVNRAAEGRVEIELQSVFGSVRISINADTRISSPYAQVFLRPTILRRDLLEAESKGYNSLDTDREQLLPKPTPNATDYTKVYALNNDDLLFLFQLVNHLEASQNESDAAQHIDDCIGEMFSREHQVEERGVASSTPLSSEMNNFIRQCREVACAHNGEVLEQKTQLENILGKYETLIMRKLRLLGESALEQIVDITYSLYSDTESQGLGISVHLEITPDQPVLYCKTEAFTEEGLRRLVNQTRLFYDPRREFILRTIIQGKARLWRAPDYISAAGIHVCTALH